jgi:hypothetical protein
LRTKNHGEAQQLQQQLDLLVIGQILIQVIPLWMAHVFIVVGMEFLNDLVLSQDQQPIDPNQEPLIMAF